MEAELKDNSSKIFKFKASIQRDYIVFDLESDSETYSTKYTFEQLKNNYKYFKQADNLEEALKLFNLLIKNQYSIEENEEKIVLTIKYTLGDIKLILDKVKDEENISFDSLYDGMKRIISDNELVLGIDLGTTYSSAAVMIDKNIIMIRNSLGSTTTPSYVAFLNKNNVYVGELAKLLSSNNKNILFNIKRLLGKNIEDEEIKEMKEKLPFKLKKEEKFNSLKIKLKFDKQKKSEKIFDNKPKFYPEEICALILKKIVSDSEFYLSKKIGRDIKIKNVVITVPAYFNQKQREATLNSAKIIGLNVKSMLNEPTAASLAYAYKSLENTDKNIIVIDFGGGTLDITLLRYKKDKNGIYCDIKFTYGNTNFGGEDFDNILMIKCLEEYKDISTNETTIIDESDNDLHYLRLKRACERAKIKLSKFNSANIHIQDYNFKGVDLTIKREEFIKYCKKIFDEFEKILDDFIIQSKIKIENIAEVILTGGSTLIPKIREIISTKFNHSTIKDDLDPKEVVAMGASIRGAKFANLPSVKDIKLFDVTNLSLGVKLKDNLFYKLIPRSTPIPYSKISTFETVLDNQDYAIIEVYEGEEEKNCDKKNLFLGKFKISGLPLKNKGETKINVKLEIKENMILEVTAIDTSDESNQEKIIIEKLNDFPEIINQLEQRQKFISLYENEDYNKIKFKLLESEDEIRKQKSKKIINEESIKSCYKNILELMGEFILNFDKMDDLDISFIKYYFSKICEFYLGYYSDNGEDLKKIKENISKIFEKIQIIDVKVIFEIIEESIDEDNIYKNFIDFIMQSLLEYINTIDLTTKNDIRKNNRDNFEEDLEDLYVAKSLIDICISLFDKFDKKKNINNYITKNDLENLKLKIIVREEIIKAKNKNFFEKIFSLDKGALRELYDKYRVCPSLDSEDLIELSEIIGKDNNLTAEFIKAENFIEWIRSKDKDDDDINKTILKILTDYPYGKNNNEIEIMWDDFAKFKLGECSKNDYLLIVQGHYETEQCSDIELAVFTEIKEYLNRLKD